MTIVKLTRAQALAAADRVKKSAYFLSSYEKGSRIDDAACSPVGAVVRRAVASVTTPDGMLDVCRHAIRGGNWFVLERANSPEDYERLFRECREDMEDGVQPLLVVERWFNLALRRANNSAGVASRDNLVLAYNSAWIFMRHKLPALYIDILDCAPRNADEVVE